MSYKEEQIVYEIGQFWILKEKPGLYKVFRSGITHSTICATVNFSDNDTAAFNRAVSECERRHLMAAQATIAAPWPL